MTEQMNVPKLRFGEFDGEYIDTALEDLTKKKISYGIVQAGPHIPNGMPYIKSTNLNKELCLDDLERTSDEIAKSYQRSEVVPEDIVFSLRGNIGATRIVPETIPVANLTQGTARLSIRDNFSNIYVNYCLGTRKAYKRVNSVSKGSTFQEISLADLRKVKITHSVDIKEQQKIASFLSKVDEKIALLTKKKDKLTEYKKGVMQQLFDGKFQEQDGKLVFVPPTLRFKADDGSEFPDWEEDKVGNIFGVTRGKVLAVSKMSETPTESYKYPVYSSQTKNNGLTGYFTDKLFSNAITWTTDGANAGEVKFRRGEFYCTNVCGVLVSSDNANNCMAELLNRITHKFVSYVGNPKLMNNTMSDIKLVYPCSAEQTQIANFLSAIDQKIDLANSELDKAKEWKKGLLQQMFV